MQGGNHLDRGAQFIKMLGGMSGGFPSTHTADFIANVSHQGESKDLWSRILGDEVVDYSTHFLFPLSLTVTRLPHVLSQRLFATHLRR